jgi:hypothetical protein
MFVIERTPVEGLCEVSFGNVMPYFVSWAIPDAFHILGLCFQSISQNLRKLSPVYFKKHLNFLLS